MRGRARRVQEVKDYRTCKFRFLVAQEAGIVLPKTQPAPAPAMTELQHVRDWPLEQVDDEPSFGTGAGAGAVAAVKASERVVRMS